jgi:hypothetical protein
MAGYLPLRHGGSPFADFFQNQHPLATPSSTLIVPELASQLIHLPFGQSESGSSPVAPASAITAIPADQLQALAQGLHALASWRPTDPETSEAA